MVISSFQSKNNSCFNCMFKKFDIGKQLRLRKAPSMPLSQIQLMKINRTPAGQSTSAKRLLNDKNYVKYVIFSAVIIYLTVHDLHNWARDWFNFRVESKQTRINGKGPGSQEFVSGNLFYLLLLLLLDVFKKSQRFHSMVLLSLNKVLLRVVVTNHSMICG